MIKKCALATALCTTVLCTAVAHESEAQIFDPDGDEFQVNVYTTGGQRDAAVAMDPSGDFVVVWHSYGSAGADNDGNIQARRFLADGTPSGDQFQVNSTTAGNQINPDVGVTSDGRVLVVWNGIQGRWYASDGMPLGGEMELHDGGSSPRIAMGSSDFVVVWEDHSVDFDGDVSLQRFFSDGSPNGAEFQVNTYTTGYQPRPRATVAPSGDFLVTWYSAGSPETDTDGYSIQARLYDSAGSAPAGQFQVNSYTTANQYLPSVATDLNGDFLVAWQGAGTQGLGIHVRRILADGSFGGDEMRISTGSGNCHPRITNESAGRHVVVWDGFQSPGSDPDLTVQGRKLLPDGTPDGDTFQVNTYTVGSQWFAAPAVNDNGDLVVVWQSDGSSGTDNDNTSIQAQRFASSAIRIFADGFESGDTLAWN